MPVVPSSGSGAPVSSATSAVANYGFTNEELIQYLYSSSSYANVLSDMTGGDKANTLTKVIRDAEQTMIVRLPMFDPTDMAGNPWVESRCTWIASHLLSKRRGNEHYFVDLYDEAIRELEAIATGEIAPPVDIPLRSHSYPSMSNIVIDEKFGTKKIRVRPQISVGGSYAGQDFTGYIWGWF